MQGEKNARSKDQFVGNRFQGRAAPSHLAAGEQSASAGARCLT